VSTTDAETRRMKMPNGGFNPAVNVQIATDTHSRAILGIEVSNEGSDNAGLSEPMRRQVEQRCGRKIQQHLLDGGYIAPAGCRTSPPSRSGVVRAFETGQKSEQSRS
jgi:hypothetical protein